jgi:MFS transporter, DHA2 family, multidrug resistance protein
MAMGGTQVQATDALTQIVTHQAVMLSTNQLMLTCAAAFMAGAVFIWLAPKPSRVEAGGFGH